MLRNILGPVFNLYLDQFLTYKICYFSVFFVFMFFFLAETPIFIVFSAKKYKFKETQKRKNTLFVNTIVLTALVQVSFFSAFFIFAVFFQFSVFFEDVFVWFPKIKKIKKPKQAKQKTRTKGRQKMQSKNKWKIMIQNKARQQAEQQKPKNNESKQNKNTKQEPETEITKTERTETRKKKRARQRKRRKWNKAKEKQRETQKKYTKMPFLGGKTGVFLAEAKTKKQNKKKQKQIK